MTTVLNRKLLKIVLTLAALAPALIAVASPLVPPQSNHHVENSDSVPPQSIDSDSIVPGKVIDVAAAVDSITANYDADWTALSMQGKLSFSGLPFRPTVKIYMKRGESVIMSARAPIFGEVARVEICPDSVTCINKHTRTYCSYPLSDISPRIINDAQDILLGQVAVPGAGRLTHDMATSSEWLEIEESGIMFYPGEELQMKEMECAFIMDPENWQLLSFALLLKQARTLIETSYIYGESGWTLGLSFTLGDKPPLQGEVELSYPDYSPIPLTFTNAGAKYRKTDFKGLMKF